MTSLRLAVLTTGRQDWGLLRPLCELLQSDRAFELLLIAGGMACSQAHGNVVEQIRGQGFELAAELPWPVEGVDPAVQASRALESVAAELDRLRPDALVLLGDRSETASAALAATLERVPVVHLCGGEETEGAFDNSLRHAITKMSHLHLVSHEVYGQRVLQMGEDPGSVHVVGSLGVENVRKRTLAARTELEASLGMSLAPPVGVVTLHPTTLAAAEEAGELQAVLSVIEALPGTWVVTLPNADPGSEEIRSAFLNLGARKDNVAVVSALGEERYLGLLKLADFLLGNSSSGMTEAPAFGVPTINVGDRQRGRIRCPSILDVPADSAAILAAIERSMTEAFRQGVRAMVPPYGGGDAAERIAAVLREWVPPNPARKVFHDTARPGSPGGPVR